MIKNLVFDFGGVIVNISRQKAVEAFQSIGVENADEYLGEYHQKDIFLKVEDGRITADEFCKELSRLCGKNISFEEAQKGWLGFMQGIPQERLELLLELKKKYKIFILSNTNPFVMDWARSNRLSKDGKSLDYYVDKIYTSYEVKAVKPDAKFFNYILQNAQIKPEESLFIDDGASNIEAGKNLGFNTFHVTNEDWTKDFVNYLNSKL